MIDALLDFYAKSNSVTLFVLALLAVYFIALNWVFFYRYFSLKQWVSKESSSLEALLLGSAGVADYSYLNHFIKPSQPILGNMVELD